MQGFNFTVFYSSNVGVISHAFRRILNSNQFLCAEDDPVNCGKQHYCF